MCHSRQSKSRGGFSLVETALAIVIIGIGIVALVASLDAGSRINGAGRDLTNAIFLAQEAREWTVQLPFSDANLGTTLVSLYSAGGLTYNPPHDGEGQQITGMSGWSQVLTVSWRDPNNLASAVSTNGSNVVNVQASIRCQGTEVYKTNWFVAQRN
jgi:Tfp pilus assembly protein PilV